MNAYGTMCQVLCFTYMLYNAGNNSAREVKLRVCDTDAPQKSRDVPKFNLTGQCWSWDLNPCLHFSFFFYDIIFSLTIYFKFYCVLAFKF